MDSIRRLIFMLGSLKSGTAIDKARVYEAFECEDEEEFIREAIRFKIVALESSQKIQQIQDLIEQQALNMEKVLGKNN